MNEVLQPERSAYTRGIREPMEALRFISRRMLEHRPRTELTLRPYFKQEHMALTPISQMAELDLSQTYPQGQPGDIAYIETCALADRDCEAVLNVAGNGEIWFNGEKVYACDTSVKPLSSMTQADYHIVAVQMRQGKNRLLCKCRKTAESWGLLLYIAYPRYPFRWTRDYLLSVRPTLPFDIMEGLEGFAHIGPMPDSPETRSMQAAIEQGAVGYEDVLHLPQGEIRWEPRWDESCCQSLVDFSAVFGDPVACAYALTYVDTRQGGSYQLYLHASGPCRVWLDGQEIPTGTPYAFDGDGTRKAILVKLPHLGGPWWLDGRVSPAGETQPVNCVPFICNGCRPPVPWIILGPFVSENGDLLRIPFQPEMELQFERPYALGDYRHGFWQLPQRDVYIRPYQDGIFFGQWFYAVQVGLHGLMFAAKAAGDEEQLRYYLDSIQVMADYYGYMHWDKEQFGDPTLIPRAWGLPDLDACGTIGVSMAEAYEMTGNPRLLTVIRDIGEAVTQHIPRFPDGTFHRVHTMWADDLYMSCPFLARLARLTGCAAYADEVYRQLEGFRQRLWIERERLFSHIYFVDEGQMSGIPWGRGNGWIAVTLTEVLTLLPSEDPRWRAALGLYQTFMQGVLACQDSCGMWHQVLNRPDSYLETSCTAMFVLSLARGIQHGWIGMEALSAAEAGWKALLQYSVDDIGDVYGVCLGSGCAKDPQYYFDLPTKKNDDHGTGIILMAAVELLKARRAWESGASSQAEAVLSTQAV